MLIQTKSLQCRHRRADRCVMAARRGRYGFLRHGGDGGRRRETRDNTPGDASRRQLKATPVRAAAHRTFAARSQWRNHGGQRGQLTPPKYLEGARSGFLRGPLCLWRGLLLPWRGSLLPWRGSLLPWRGRSSFGGARSGFRGARSGFAGARSGLSEACSGLGGPSLALKGPALAL